MQFSLKAMMTATFLVALVCILCMHPMVRNVTLAMIHRALGPVLVIGVVYGRDHQRTFSIGAATTYATGYLERGSYWLLDFQNLPFIVVSGGLAIATRRFLQKRQKPPIAIPPSAASKGAIPETGSTR